MGRAVKPYAQRIVQAVRTDVHAINQQTQPAIDTAEVVGIKGGVKIQPANATVTYEEDDLIWNIDPDSLKTGDSVTIGRDPMGHPIVFGKVDGMQPDPSIHPEYIKFKKRFDRLRDHVKVWKAPVSTVADLPAKGNSAGDVRLVFSTDGLYRWKAATSSWVLIAGGTGGASSLDDLLDVVISSPSVGQTLVYNGTQWVNVAPTTGDLNGLTDVTLTAPVAGQVMRYNGSQWVNVTESWVDSTGDTMSGNLTMSSGTVVMLPDAPVANTDAVNKAYVDAAIAAVVTVGTPTVVVNSNYTAGPNDQTILVNSCAALITITLPANHIDTKLYEVKDYGGCAATNNITVVSADGDTIDGAANFILTTPYQSLTVVSDGSDWHIV